MTLELREKKCWAVKAKESDTQRKRRKNENDKKQILLTNFLPSDPVARDMRRERKRKNSFHDIQGKSKKNRKEKKKSRNSVRMMLQKSEGDPKATRGG